MESQSTIKFPRWVFRCPGPLSRPGGTFSQQLAHDMDEAAQLLAEGWHPTLPEAIDAQPKQPKDLSPSMSIPILPAAIPIEDDSLMPTRAEIEAKMTELGLKMDKRKSDATLLTEIDMALKRRGKSP